MDQLLQDLRFSLRSLVKRPVFTAVAVVTLALGIGANTGVFSVVNAVLIRPLPYEDPERLTLIWTNFGPDLPQNWVSGPEYAQMREYSGQFSEIGLVVPTTVAVSEAGDPEQVGAAAVSGSFFRTLRVKALHGRLVGPEDDRPGAAPVVVLSHGFWQRRYGGDPSILRRTLHADGQPYTVVGVLPSDFRILHPDAQFPDRVDLWVPAVPVIGADYTEMPRGNHFFRAIGRLRPDVTLQQAQADMDAVALEMAEEVPGYYGRIDSWGITVLSMHEDLVEDVKPALWILLAAVGFVLLIACVNVANLQLTRAAAREREMAVRAAMGAGRGRLIRQLLTESLVLALAGGILGLLLALGLVRLLVGVAPEGLPLSDAITIDGTVLLFTLVAAGLTALLFGLAPCFVSLKRSLVSSLKEGARGVTSGVGGQRLRRGLVVSEVALALILLVGAGLMMKSLDRLLRVDPGYETERLLTMRVALPGSSYDNEASVDFWRQLLDRVEGLPGVVESGAISHLPLSGSYASGSTGVEHSDVVERPQGATYPYIEADRRWATPGYFRTMGVELLEGRVFTRADNRDATPVAIVDDEFARRFWPGESPIGKRVSINVGADEPTWREVVGLVRHSRHYDLRSVGREQVYFPHAQFGINAMYLTVRTTSEPEPLARAVHEEIWALDPNQPVDDVQPMRARVQTAVAQPRFNLFLLGGFAAVALVLAAVGIYGVIAYSVGQRTHEVGVRMALGADRGAVRWLFLRQGMTTVVLGLAVGVLAALALARTLTGLLFDVSATDPVTYLGVAALLALVAAAACLIPAARATRVEPATVLREE